MNRIYQGKVTAVEIPGSEGEQGRPLDIDILWQHHGLLQETHRNCKKQFGHKRQNRVSSSWLRPLTTFLPSFERHCNFSNVKLGSRNQNCGSQFNICIISLRRLGFNAKLSGQSPTVNLRNKSIDNQRVSGYLSSSMLTLLASPKPQESNFLGFEIVESEEFLFSKTLIGEADKVDVEIDNLICDMAQKPDSFRIVDLQNTRMAVIRVKNHSFAVFFRIISSLKQIELRWCVTNNL
jgi:hypothetical protein